MLKKITFFSKKSNLVLLSLFLSIFNVIIYCHLIHELNDKNKNLLIDYSFILKNILKKDLEFISSDDGNIDELFFLQNSIKKITTQEDIDNKNILYFKKGNNFFMVDIQNLKEFLDKLLPSYISYSIIYKDKIIAISTNFYKEYLDEAVQSVGDNFVIQIKFNNQSEYYDREIQKVWTRVLISILVTTILVSVLYSIFVKKFNRFLRVINRLKALLDIQKTKINIFSLRENTKYKLNTLYIEAASEIILQNSDITFFPESRKDFIDSSKNIFPIMLKGLKVTNIDINELSRDLNNFFSKIEIIGTEIKNFRESQIIVNCSKAVFYQIIFGLVFNLLKFMDDQSSVKKTLKIEVTSEKIRLIYRGYPLNKESMINISNTVYNQFKDTFLLTCEKVFLAMDSHKIQYQLFSSVNYTIIEIYNLQFNKDTEVEKYNNSRIVRFKR